jgi:protein-disulfide isomerase
MPIARTLALLSFVLLAACNPATKGDAKTIKPQNPWEMAGDMAMGNAKAKVVVIEYASVTCVHCAHFHKTVWPTLKTKYIDSGKVRFVFREFPTPPVPVSVAGFMVAHCAGPDKYFKVVDGLFRAQETILTAQSPRSELLKIAKMSGLTEDKFNACIEDSATLKHIQGVIDVGLDTYKISATPSFVINGTTHRGLTTIEQFDEIITPLLAKK